MIIFLQLNAGDILMSMQNFVEIILSSKNNNKTH